MTNQRRPKKAWVVFLSTYPPRECGIATFTQDLSTAFDKLYSAREESRIIAMNNGDSAYFYPKKVILEINDREQDGYIEAARKINAMPQVKLINIQHEYGIYGGGYGSHVINFMKEVDKPVVLTMHTVLPGPNEHLKETTIALIEQADRVIVMTKRSKEILVRDYVVAAEKIAVIPHGIHPLPYTNTIDAKKDLKLEGKTVISTFGLLSSGKGIEYAIEAMPEVVKRFPNAVYLVIGATHPSVLKKDGEKYRNSLIAKAHKLGLGRHVLFYNKYLALPELLKFLQATDVYMALPLDPNQAVSGTLSYALGTGRPVIATKFAQALEDVTPDIGTLVDFKNSVQVKNALINMLENGSLTEKMGERAYFRTRRMEWRNVVIGYMNEYTSLVPHLAKREKNLPKIKLRHFIKLTDDFGMFQFAKFTEPDPAWGYTLDDNVRALVAVVKYYEKLKGSIALKLARTYLTYIEYTAQPDGRFHNYVNADKTFHRERNETEDLDDANARASYALAYAAASKDLPFDIRHKAALLFKNNLNLKRTTPYARTAAYHIKAYNRWLTVEENPEMKKKLEEYCDTLVNLYRQNSTNNWQWFEEQMTYSNAVLPEALLIGFKLFGHKHYFDIGKSTLDFLLNYSFQGDTCVPIGQNGWFKKGGEKQAFDQQPEEVTALVQCLNHMRKITKDEFYCKKMRDAFNWFMGNNLLGQIVYDQETGGCYDGVGEKQVNLNQGAESTVVYLLARLCMED